MTLFAASLFLIIGTYNKSRVGFFQSKKLKNPELVIP